LPVSPPDRPDQAPSPPQPRSELTNEATTPATTTPRHQHAPKTGPGPVMSRPLQLLPRSRNPVGAPGNRNVRPRRE
jgi:hypothetical protein